MGFFEAGAWAKERAILGGNRSGKTHTSQWELDKHLRGVYPAWWKGRLYDKPITALCCGVTNVQTTGVLQEGLLGPRSDMGTGMIPKSAIGRHLSNPGSPDALVSCEIKHSSGGFSKILFKSYQHDVESFQGYKFDFVLLDEEPPVGRGHYSECITRTMTTNGSIVLSCTPLWGMTELIQSFLPKGVCPEDGVVNKSKWTCMIGWDDVPHISEDQKAALLSAYLPYEIEARSKGIPSIGAGAIYPVPESQVYMDPFPLPPHWPRAYGLDVGWNRTAAVWGAYDEETDTTYIYSEHYVGRAEPSTHAAAINARGAWIPGAVDPAAGGSSQVDGRRLIDMYYELGLSLVKADNSVVTGIQTVWELMSSGRLKIFNSCLNLRNELRTYQYNKDGKVADHQEDHACDALRYYVMTGRKHAMTSPTYDAYEEYQETKRLYNQSSTINKITGY